MFELCFALSLKLVGLQAAAIGAREVADDAHTVHQTLKRTGATSEAEVDEAERAASNLNEAADAAETVATNLESTVKGLMGALEVSITHVPS